MGIDIYARWKGQSKRERKAQVTGWSTVYGHVGYLREAYHGGPYVTRFLVREAFEAKESEAAISAAVLRERLPQAVVMALYRQASVYGEGDPGTVTIEGPEDILKLVARQREQIEEARSGTEGDAFARSVSVELLRHALDCIEARALPEVALSFVDFVALCVRKEEETGEPCRIVASY